MTNLAQARSRSLAAKRAAMFEAPKSTVLQQIEQEGREDWEHEGEAAMNPYMGAEGDAWARGFWSAQA